MIDPSIALAAANLPPDLAQNLLPPCQTQAAKGCSETIQQPTARQHLSVAATVPNQRFSAAQPSEPPVRFPQPGKTASAASAPSSFPGVLRQGSRGAAVRTLQQQLAQQQFNPGPADGVFGAQTQAAVRQFQTAHNLTADGIVGADTWQQINRLPRAASPFAETPFIQSVQPEAPRSRPQFSPPVLPAIQFHPLQVADRSVQTPQPLAPQSAESRDLTLVWLTLLTLATASGAAFGLRQYRRQQPKTDAQQTIHQPMPVYPASPMPAVTEAAPVEPTEAVQTDLVDACLEDLRRLSTQSALTTAQLSDCLENFLFDLLDPYSRHRLIRLLQESQPNADHALGRMLGFLPMPVYRVASFPSGDGSGQGFYRYSLVDDLGGCFVITDNEMWITKAAYQWLELDVPYTITVRREDNYGEVLEKQFSIVIQDPETEVEQPAQTRQPQPSLVS